MSEVNNVLKRIWEEYGWLVGLLILATPMIYSILWTFWLIALIFCSLCILFLNSSTLDVLVPIFNFLYYPFQNFPLYAIIIMFVVWLIGIGLLIWGTKDERERGNKKQKKQFKENDIQKFCKILGVLSGVIFLIAWGTSGVIFYSEEMVPKIDQFANITTETKKAINWQTVIPLLITIGCFFGYDMFADKNE